MNRQNEPLQGYVIDGTIRHMNLFVPDPERAWHAAMDVKGWLESRRLGAAEIKLLSGTPKQVGVTYLSVYKTIRGGGDTQARQVIISEQYVLTNIDEANQQLTFKYTLHGNSTLQSPRVRQLTVAVDKRMRANGVYLVSFTTDGHLDGEDFDAGIPCCSCLNSLASASARWEVNQMLPLLQSYFTNYIPEGSQGVATNPAPGVSAPYATGATNQNPGYSFN